jgi:hypothetical protein
MGIGAQGNLGWAAILCPLVFIYFGVRYYRDRYNNREISFLVALKVGLLITIMPSLFYALIETIYVAWIDPDFYKNIFARELQVLKTTLPPAEYSHRASAMKQELIRDNNPVYNFSTIALFIAACGAIISLLSSLLLMRPFKKEVVTA